MGAAVVAVLLLAGPAWARPTLDGGRLEQLDRFEVLTFTDAWRNGIERGKAIGVFEATPEEVFRIATDFGHYKHFMPRVTAAEQVSRTSEGATVVITADLPVAGRQWIEAEYRFQKLPGEIYKISFEMKRGNMKQYIGSMYIEPWTANANKAAVTYEIVAEPSVVAPKSFVNKHIRRSAGSVVHALRQQVNELHRMGLLHPIAPPTLVAPATILSPDPATLKAKR